MTKKAMLIAPFSAWMDWNEGEMFLEKRQLLENIITTLESNGYDILSSHRGENWGKEWWPADECTKLDYEWIESSDLVVALPGDPASGGTHIELGWRTAHGKNLAVLLENDGNYSPLVHGLGDAFENVDYIKYETQKDCLESLNAYLGNKPNILRRIAKPLAVAASVMLALGIAHLTDDYRAERQSQESRTAVLRDYARGLAAEGEYHGEHGTVISHGDMCVMHPSGWDTSKLRLYGIKRDTAQKKVLSELAKL